MHTTRACLFAAAITTTTLVIGGTLVSVASPTPSRGMDFYDMKRKLVNNPFCRGNNTAICLCICNELEFVMLTGKSYSNETAEKYPYQFECVKKSVVVNVLGNSFYPQGWFGDGSSELEAVLEGYWGLYDSDSEAVTITSTSLGTSFEFVFQTGHSN